MIKAYTEPIRQRLCRSEKHGVKITSHASRCGRDSTEDSFLTITWKIKLLERLMQILQTVTKDDEFPDLPEILV